MQDQFAATGRFATANSLKYLTQLCKHFGHKVPAEMDGAQGRITFDMGIAQLIAHEQSLEARLKAPDAAAISRLQAIIDDHLKRFAFREEFDGMTWAKQP